MRDVIDVHVHLASPDWLDGAMGPYLGSIESFFGRTIERESVEETAARYDALGVTAVLLGWDAERHTGRPAIPNATIADIVVRVPDTFVGFGSVDPLRPDAADRVREVRDLGLRGMKLHPTIQGFDPATDEFVAFYEQVADAGLCVLTHVGNSGVGAGQPGGQGLRIDVAQPSRLDRVAAEFPDTNIMLAHLGAPWENETLAMALHKTNVFTDISGWKLKYLPEAVRRDMRGRLRGQVCFGSDYPMFDPAQQLADARDLDLAPEIEAAVLGGNARRFLGL